MEINEEYKKCIIRKGNTAVIKKQRRWPGTIFLTGTKFLHYFSIIYYLTPPSTPIKGVMYSSLATVGAPPTEAITLSAVAQGLIPPSGLLLTQVVLIERLKRRLDDW